MKFVLATHNPNKIREMGAILSQFGVEGVAATLGTALTLNRPSSCPATRRKSGSPTTATAPGSTPFSEGWIFSRRRAFR